jgi:hypothetical protein
MADIDVAVLRPFRAGIVILIRYQGRRASHLPLAIIFRAVGACRLKISGRFYSG